MCRYGRADVTLWAGVDLWFLARSVGLPPPQLRVHTPIQGQSSGWQLFALGDRREEGRFTMTVKRTSYVTPVMTIALMTVMLLVVSVVPAGAGQAEGSGIVLLLESTDKEEAQRVLGEMPLAVAGFIEFDLIPLQPLMPLGMLIGRKMP